MARARMELASGMKESMGSLVGPANKGVTSQEAIHLLLVNQYLDTLAAVKPDEIIARVTPNEVFDMNESLLIG